MRRTILQRIRKGVKWLWWLLDERLAGFDIVPEPHRNVFTSPKRRYSSVSEALVADWKAVGDDLRRVGVYDRDEYIPEREVGGEGKEGKRK